MATQVEPERFDLGSGSVADQYRHEMLFSGEFNSCPDFTGDENYCRGGRHGIARDMGEGQFPTVQETRQCPSASAKEARRRRRQALAECELIRVMGINYRVSFDVQRPLWSQLLKAMDAERPITWTMDGKTRKPLVSLLDMLNRGCRQPSKDAPHLLIEGPCGTGKTTIQGVLYLAACEAGFSVAFHDSIVLRKLAKDLTSKFTTTSEAADKAFNALAARDVLIWSDVGDTQATHPEFREMLTALLERFRGRLIMSSNLGPAGLKNHPDIGERAVSRMLAGRHGKASIRIQLVGDDQRTGGTPLQTVTEL